MKTQRILIDFENVQPTSLSPLKGRPVHVYVFVGANQAKLPFELAQSIQELGDAASYVKIEGSGKNALDFHIAYFLGELSQAHPQDSFLIVSKDTGFDPLIEFLKTHQRANARRISDLQEIQSSQSRHTLPIDQKITLVIDQLKNSPSNLPRKDNTLRNRINSSFQMQLATPELDAIVKSLQSSKHIRIDQGKVSYPKLQSAKTTSSAGNN